MEVCQLELSQLPLCAELFIDAFKAPPWNERWALTAAVDRLKSAYQTPGAYSLVAVEDGAILGFLIGVVERWYKGSHYQVKELCVGVSYQRRGVGKSLIEALQQGLSGQSVTMIYLLTMRHSVAETFYLQNGFTPHSDLVVVAKTLS
ncbi:MAG: GNAT family N-acetyltransferase [Phormidesmis sp.]